jgi:hypothetical protein
MHICGCADCRYKKKRSSSHIKNKPPGLLKNSPVQARLALPSCPPSPSPWPVPHALHAASLAAARSAGLVRAIPPRPRHALSTWHAAIGSQSAGAKESVFVSKLKVLPTENSVHMRCDTKYLAHRKETIRIESGNKRKRVLLRERISETSCLLMRSLRFLSCARRSCVGHILYQLYGQI